MKKIIIIFSLFITALSACKENERLEYSTKQGLYFPDLTNADSINYTFTMTKEKIDTIDVIVKLLGKPFNEDKTFKLNILSSSTAKVNHHFKPFDENYTLRKGKTTVSIPIYLLYSNELDENTVELNFSIQENESFDIGYVNRNQVRMLITNQLILPSYWDDLLVMYFDEYSKVKHAKCIEIMGHDFPFKEPSTSADYQYYMKAGREAASYFAENPTMDENGVMIAPWSPF